MKFTYTCKKVSLNDSVKAYAEKKVGKLEKFFKEEPEASVTFSVEKKNRCVAEIMLRGANGTLFRAVCEDPDGDMRGADALGAGHAIQPLQTAKAALQIGRLLRRHAHFRRARRSLAAAAASDCGYTRIRSSSVLRAARVSFSSIWQLAIDNAASGARAWSGAAASRLLKLLIASL